MTASIFEPLWKSIEAELEEWDKAWPRKIELLDQVSRVKERKLGHRYTDSEVFGGIVKAVLSGNTDWSRIQPVLPELAETFNGFDIEWYSKLSRQKVRAELVTWFDSKKAGSQYLEKNLNLLTRTAAELRERKSLYTSLENYLSTLLLDLNGEVALVARALGSFNSPHKLSALGIPIAAEALKNIGYDVAKPDRHVNRAIGNFGLVSFRKWSDKTNTKPPLATNSELVQVMQKIHQMAKEINVEAALLDNCLWLLCAKSGAYLPNWRLVQLAGSQLAGHE